MNWSDTKTILIITFLSLNLFLGWQLWQKHQAYPELIHVTEGSLEELLELHQIRLETELDGEQPALPQLEVGSLTGVWSELPREGNETIRLDGYVLSASLTPPWPGGALDPVQLKQQFVNQYVYQGELYQFSDRTQNRVSFVQHHGEYPLFAAQLHLNLDSEQAVTDYTQVYFEVQGVGEEQPTISAYTGLRTLIDQEILPPRAVIHDVTLGYYGQVLAAENQILSPVWRVIFEDADGLKVTYVNAYTGALELDSTIELESVMIEE